MKKLIALIICALCMSAALCSCDGMNDTVNRVKNTASEAVSDMDKSSGITDSTRATSAPAVSPETQTQTDYTEDGIGEDVDEMIDNGEVEDGDGNVGDLENGDSDPYIDENAAEYAQEQISSDDDTD